MSASSLTSITVAHRCSIVMSWLSSFFGAEFQGRPLQKTGDLSKSQLLQFFEHGTELFSKLDFKKALNEAFLNGGNVQEMVDQAQAKLFEEKVEPAVQGDYGIHSLQFALSKFGRDPEFAAKFYQFVHLEEKTLDEAEMEPEVFHEKYSKLDQMQRAMEQKLKENEEQMQGMSDMQKQQFMAELHRTIVAESLQLDPSSLMSGPRCMPGGSTAQQPQPDQAPQLEELQHPGHATRAATAAASTAVGGAMTEAQQLQFFQSMNAAPQ